MRTQAASLAVVVSLLSACASTETMPSPTADPAPTTSATPPDPTAWSDDAEADLLRVFDETMAAAEVSGYTETWTFAEAPSIVRVLDPNAPDGGRAAQQIGDGAAERIDRGALLVAYLGAWVLKHSVPPGTVREGHTFTTTVDNPTVSVMVVETADGLMTEIFDYFGDLEEPVTSIRIEYTVTPAGQQVLNAAQE
ncbi:hypothetical protein BH10ACT7_BH10ACT7_16660 [soil metagenome]